MKTFIDGLTEQFRDDLTKVIEKEVKENHLPQGKFSSCLERASAGIDEATKGVKKTLALAIALHREKEHGEDTMEEQAVLLADESTSATIGTLGYWNH